MDTFFREFVEAAPDAILEVDQAGTIRRAEEGSERVFRRSATLAMRTVIVPDKILVIDDEPSSLELVMAALAQPGVEILGTGDPEEGLALFHRHQPEIVLVDMRMSKIGARS